MPLPGVAVALLALWVGGRRERRSRAFARNAALTRFVLEMRHNAVLQARGARMVDVLLCMGPEQVPAGLPPRLSVAALEGLPADAYSEDRAWPLPSRRAPLHAAPLYLASLRLQVADWNSAVRLWEIQPAYLSQDGARTLPAAATFGVYMGLQQVADLLPKGDAEYVRGMTRCSDAVAETAVPIPADWQEHTGEAAQQRD